MTGGRMNAPSNVLLVEDSPTDALLVREAFHEIGLTDTLHVVEDGVQALNFLHQIPPYDSAPRPGLILLDLNLPRKNGREVLAEIKNNPSLQSIATVVLTTSNSDEDVLTAYNLHANCYIVKPIDFHDFLRAMRAIEQFWFDLVRLPPEE